MKIGQGYDRHRLAPDRDLILGGVKIDYHLGLDGHSDADVLLHAITDALLGAIGQGDIGELFPDTDPQYKGADSAKLLSVVVEKVRSAGYQIANIDCTIFAQKPKLVPHKPLIKSRVAQLLDINENLVNIKAKTGESRGAVGREEVIDAAATVLLT
ncbi:2-C-methyl-D-erythritol 2,4-cyclodiphosphate synthase [Lacunimicrobium album]